MLTLTTTFLRNWACCAVCHDQGRRESHTIPTSVAQRILLATCGVGPMLGRRCVNSASSSTSVQLSFTYISVLESCVSVLYIASAWGETNQGLECVLSLWRGYCRLTVYLSVSRALDDVGAYTLVVIDDTGDFLPRGTSCLNPRHGYGRDYDAPRVTCRRLEGRKRKGHASNICVLRSVANLKMLGRPASRGRYAIDTHRWRGKAEMEPWIQGKA